MTRSLDQLVESYIALRALKKSIEEETKTRLAPLNETMAKLEAVFLDHMSKNGITSFATDAGTAYQSTNVTASVVDWEAFYQWCVAEKQLGMLIHGANRAAVAAFADETETVPPGLNFSRSIVVNVRKAREQ